MKIIHRHVWARVDFFRPLRCFMCACGAACSDIHGSVHYSQRKAANNAFVWKLISRPRAEVV